MQLIQNGTQGPTAPPVKQIAVGTPGYAYGGPAGSTPSSRWDPDVANTIIAEIVNVILAAGIALDPTNNAQLLAALRAIGFPTGLGTLTTNTTVTGTAAGTYYNINGSSVAVTITATTFAAGQTIGFLARTACTVATSSGTFYGGSLSGSSLAMPAGSFVALEWDGVNWRTLAASPDILGFATVTALNAETTRAEAAEATKLGFNIQTFSTSGTFTVPAGVTKVEVEVWGGGGGGGGASSGDFGSGGGGGGYGRQIITGLTSGSTIAVTIGAGGGGGGISGAGASGGTSSFGSFISCTGGVFGSGNSTLGGGGGTASGSGINLGVQGGGGGPGFVSAAPGTIVGGSGGDASCGGSGGNSSTVFGNVGIFPGGGGGGGAANNIGGGGSQGFVIVRW